MHIPKYLFSFDAEADGLTGDIFAIGVVILDWNGNIIDQFSGVAESAKVEDQWVKDNVIAHTNKLPQYNTRQELRNAFWEFWIKYKLNSLPLADVGVPVEANLILKTINDDPKTRSFKGPYPLYDVSAFLLTVGLDPIRVKRKDFVERSDLKDHNPVDDALASGLTVIKLRKEFNLLNFEK